MMPDDREALAAQLSNAFHLRPDDLGEGCGTWDYMADAILTSHFMARVKRDAYDSGFRDGRAET